MILFMGAALWLGLSSVSGEEFRHFGHFLIQSHFKLHGGEQKTIPIKPVVFDVATDGISVRVSVHGEQDSASMFQIYRSDGIGRQRGKRGALEVIPGLQALSQTTGEVRHLRLCKEFMTITTFPGVSDQTVVIHAIAAEPKPSKKPATPPKAP